MNKFICSISFVFISFFTIHSQTNEHLAKVNKYAYKNQDSVYYYSQKIIDSALTKNDWENIVVMRFKNCKTGLFFHNFKKTKDNLDELDSIFNLNTKAINSSKSKLTYYNRLSYNKGNYYYRLNDYKNAVHHFNCIIKRSANLHDSLLNRLNKSYLSIAYSNTGKIYANENKMNLANSYYQLAIRFAELKNKENKDLNFSIYNLLADLLQEQNNIKASNSFFFKTLDYHKSINSRNSVITTTSNIIENYLKINKLDSAKYYLNDLKIEFNKNHSKYDRYYKVASKVYEAKNNYKNALSALHQNLKFISLKWEDAKNAETAEAYNLIGDFHLRSSDFHKALSNYDLALNQFSEDSINSTINQTIQFKILKQKTNALNQLKSYTKSLETSDIAISILDSLKPSFKTNSDKLFLIENSFPVFENGIEAAYKLFQETKDSKYIDQAFFYSEKSKSTLLLEALLSSQASKFANIPENIIEKEKQLKAKITYLEKQINKKSTTKLQDQLFDLKQDHRHLIRDIELNYKRYYDLKYNTQVVSLQELQKRLDDTTTLLSYFYGNHSMYTISVTKNTKHIKRLQWDGTFETLLKDSYALLSNPKSNLTLLKQKTHELYQKLIQHSLSKSSKNNLIIIPDGLLNYLPFGSLSVNDNEFLIQNHSINYANSVTLLLQLQSKNQHNNQVLAFAPNFDNSNTSALLSLPNNSKEVKQVLSHFKGEAFTNEKASLKNFNSKNKDFGIIHLATHAILDDENPEYSYLAFSPNTQTENLLYTNDLYNLELNSNMVTLSACESGIGNLKRGEGMMSLARGFYFSGTSSIASTLWKVNDASSSQLMDDFYKNLSNGNPKDKSLQKAKINFIKANKDNALSHPYYWSGFITSGNSKALTSNLQWTYLASALLVLLAFGLILYRKKYTN